MDKILLKQAINEKDVVRANRVIYNRKRPEDYGRVASIFNDVQRNKVRRILRHIRRTTGGERFLDVGCGTGHLIGLALPIFPHCFGVDVAEKLLCRISREIPGARFTAASASELPFEDRSFDAVGMYALLHHMYDPISAVAEAYRVLRPGGILYTDHDPNWYLGRIYRLWRQLKSGKQCTFDSPVEDLAEYHHAYTAGINPEKLAEGLKAIGFRKVKIRYRHSTNPNLSGLHFLALALLKHGNRIFPARSFFTHFIILAHR